MCEQIETKCERIFRRCIIRLATPDLAEAQTAIQGRCRDIGLGDWLFDMDSADDVARITKTVLALAQDPAASKAKAAKARDFVQQRQRETMAIVAKQFTK